MDDRRRRLVMMHEQEHVRAGDNQLLGIATLVVMLMPWNAALWWQLRRLRQGVELDCDRRVLKRSPDAEGYGELLIEMGQRSATPALAFAAFAESSSFLDRRIRSIVPSQPRRARLLVGSFGAVALASTLLAWAPPSPRLIEATVPFPSPPTVPAPLPADPVGLGPGSPVAAPTDTTGASFARPTAGGVEGVAEAGDPAEPASIEPPSAPSSEAPIARRPRVEELVQRDYPGIFSGGLAVDQAIWYAIDRNGALRRSWIGPNLYINVGAAGGGPREMALPVGSPERAIAEAEHRQLEQQVLQANVPELEIQSMYAGFFSGDGGSAVVHFVTEHPGAGNWGRFRVASAFVADAIDSELGP
jgi:hypothetical protein